MLEAYNGGFLFGNSLGDTAQEITILGLDAETKGDVEKAHISARGKNWQPRSSSARSDADMGS